MQKDYKNNYPVKQGMTRFIVKYSGFGIDFSTEIDDETEAKAKAYFNLMYPSAKFISISKKTIK